MKPDSTLLSLTAVVCGLSFASLPDAHAAQFDLAGPAGSGAFGTSVIVLPNGNFVVTDPGYDVSGTNDVGAVYLYDGVTLAVISTLTGGTVNDGISTSVKVLSNGNFIVLSPNWDNGAMANAGAVTWGSGVSGVSGVVSSANSLVGSTANDQVGNGGVTVLNNGNYVVSSVSWSSSRGAVTWGSGTSGVSGTVSAANSLIGSTANDFLGNGGVLVLSNGNYVVTSSAWDNVAVVDAGAVTWGSGTTGVIGAVSAANSLVGSTTGDSVGNGGVTALANGNYVVRSPSWDNGAVVDAGAVTWGSGTTGVSNTISAANSLVGSTTGDAVGSGGVTALNNGNYVVSSPSWDNGAVTNAGAVTWASGMTGATGAVSTANSLVGSTTGDGVGGVTALNNGNYVVSSPSWDNGAVTNVGAATWASGATGATGAVSVANSLVGSTTGDGVGNLTALNNGNYVVSSPSWDSGAVTNAGAVTWANGATGVTGVVSTANSLVGSTTGDFVGNNFVIALNNGNYVVNSTSWDNGAVTNVGAVTWSSGTAGVTGTVSVANSLVGTKANDQVGTGGTGVNALNNGNYVVCSTSWDNGAVTNAGAVTWGSGTTGVSGAVSAANSLVGSTLNDQVGFNGAFALNNGNYLVRSTSWDNGAVTNAGAVTLGDGTLGTSGVAAAINGVLGTVANGGNSMVFASDYDYLNTRLLVGQPLTNRVSLFGYVPEIAVQQPLNINLADGGTRIFGAPVGTNTSLTFTIKNINVANLTGLGITIDGSDAALFTVTASPTAPVSGPFGSTTFTVRFAPTTTGDKTAALHIANNDPDENPFDINLSGQVLLLTQDTDGDGLSDASEFLMAVLGFDWQVSQSGLVGTLTNNVNGAGYFTPSQVQALNVGGPLIQKNPTNGLFTLTIGVQKATNLVDFLPFPMTAPQTMINGLGELEFQFTVPDNAGFFRLESK